MTKENAKMNTQIKNDRKIFMEFKSRSFLKGQKLPEALDHAMELYNEEAKKGDK